MSKIVKMQSTMPDIIINNTITTPSRIKNVFVVYNHTMKYPQGKKYASNADEKETFLPSQYDLETKSDDISSK